MQQRGPCSCRKYVQEHLPSPNSDYFGIAKDGMSFYLRGLQQFVIDYKLNVDSVEYE